jgi:hypothetical protein
MTLSKILSDRASVEKYYFIVAVLFSISSTILITTNFVFFRFSFPPIGEDEASFISPAYNLLMKGKFSSDIHASFLPEAVRYTYWMPPFFMFSLAGFLKIFGIGITQAKLFSALCIISAGLCLGFSMKNWTSRCWITALFWICPFVIFSSTIIRMEAMGILLTTTAIFCLRCKESHYQNSVLGVIAALCLMTHPMVIACTVALGIIVLKRGLKAFSIFLVTVLIVLSPYVIYIMQDQYAFFAQMSLQFARKGARGISTLTLPYAMQTFPLAVLAAILLFKIHESLELKWFLGLGLLLTVVVILRSQEFNYHVYSIPYVLAITGFYIDGYQNKFKILLPFLVFGFFIVLLAGKTKYYHLHDNRPYYDLIDFLHQHQSNWSDKKIFVEGEPDVSIFFLVKGQDVARINAFALTKKDWADNYEYVICATSKYPTYSNSKCYNADNDGYKLPWLEWSKTTKYSSRNDIYSLLIYER